MAVVSINSALPSGASNVGGGARDIRANKQAIVTGLAVATNFANTAEPIKPGWGRTFVAAASASSHPSQASFDGMLFFASDTSRLYVYSSFNDSFTPELNIRTIGLVGTPRYIEHRSVASGYVWQTLSGASRFGASVGNRTVFYETNGVASSGTPGFVFPPQIYITSSTTQMHARVVDVSVTSFVVSVYTTIDASASAFTLNFLASGLTLPGYI